MNGGSNKKKKNNNDNKKNACCIHFHPFLMLTLRHNELRPAEKGKQRTLHPRTNVMEMRSHF